MSDSTRPIGVFDSGLGGLTVLKEMASLLPDEQFVYFGDTARLPYGSKSPETIIRYSLENASFLLQHHVKAIVIACNTASAFALKTLSETLPIPVIGVIAPGAKQAVETSQSGRIAVIATKGTVASGAYIKSIYSLRPKAEVVQVACPLLVPFVEEGMVRHPAMKLVVEEYLMSIKAGDFDTVLLGCTHYPLIKDVLSEYFGENVSIVDSGRACAEELKAVLHFLGQLNEGAREISHKYFVSDAPQDFIQMSAPFMGEVIRQVACVS
ncbi:MAG: glutamate racemase [Chlamydiota bacterium]|nr:glutamate racemase [Chlamydiota bacterium]